MSRKKVSHSQTHNLYPNPNPYVSIESFCSANVISPHQCCTHCQNGDLQAWTTGWPHWGIKVGLEHKCPGCRHYEPGSILLIQVRVIDQSLGVVDGRLEAFGRGGTIETKKKVELAIPFLFIICTMLGAHFICFPLFRLQHAQQIPPNFDFYCVGVASLSVGMCEMENKTDWNLWEGNTEFSPLVNHWVYGAKDAEPSHLWHFLCTLHSFYKANKIHRKRG